MIEVKRKPSIKTKPIEFLFDKDQTDRDTKKFVEQLDTFPIVYLFKESETEDDAVSGITIPASSIRSVKLFNANFLPEIELNCDDEQGNFMDDFFPTDYDIVISIFVKSTHSETMPFRMDFKVTEYIPLQSNINTTSKKFLMKGILNVEELHYTLFEAFPSMTSYKVLKDVSNKLKLGFATNMSDTNDTMTWINPSDSYMDFIQKVTQRAYISDTSFVWTFIDFYYNLNFIDIEQELSDPEKPKQSMDSSFVSDNKENLVDLYLSTNDNLLSTNKYISKYILNNKSFLTNIKEGYSFSNIWFDKKNNSLEQKYIVENETPDDNLIQLITKKGLRSNNWEGAFTGKIDTDNVHENYAMAIVLNEINISKLHKVTMVVTLKSINFEIRRFQKIMVDFYDTNLLKNDSGVKENLSGYWFVSGINYNYKRNGGATQEVTLIRRDLNVKHKELFDLRKTLDELKDKK